MPNEEHYAKLKKGVKAWNHWREVYPDIRPDLTEAYLMSANLDGANLSGANLSRAYLLDAHLISAHLSEAYLMSAHLDGADLDGANLRKADLDGANLRKAHLMNTDLSGAHLWRANLSGAHLSGAILHGAHLSGAILHGAHLSGAILISADLSGAYLDGANLSGADLFQANLQAATLVGTNFERANLTGCSVYGISAWNINLRGAQQTDLVITPGGEPVITVDDVEVAQFIYLLLHNEKIRQVIETITSKTVLILGRFEPPERKAVLDAIREELRRQNYVPILFDFEGPQTRDFTETISTLAFMARFIIADLTEPRSLPKELEAIVPTLAVPVQPVLAGATPYGMFQDYWKYQWVLPVYRYESLEGLIASLGDQVITPAEAKVRELSERRRALAETQLTPRPATG